MTAMLTGNWMKLAIKILIAIAIFAYMIELAIAIFAGNYESIYHVILPGYVQIRTAGRYGHATIWVKPWVAEMHHWAIGIMIVAVILFLVLGLIARVAKRPTPHAPKRMKTE
jgi:hypothetical protein